MKAKRSIILRIFLCVVLFIAVSQDVVVAKAAAEQTAEESATVAEEVGVLKDGEAKAKNLTAVGLKQIIKVVPYVGVVLFIVGILVAVFSTRNKGNRRWGLKLAISETIITYILYIALTLVYDFAYNDGPVRLSSRPEQEAFYEKAYYDTVDGMKEEGQSFLFLGEDWLEGAAVASRRMYVSIVGALVFVSISAGVLLLIVTKRDKAIRRFAFAGMCIATPVTLVIGYLFLKM